MNLTRNQWEHLLVWAITILPIEILLLIFPQYAWILFGLGGGTFIGGFIFRILKIYPGKSEPLIIDLLTGLLGLIASILFAPWELIGISKRFLLTVPPLVLLPHIVNIIADKTLEKSWVSSFTDKLINTIWQL